jgi:hypothetical protein
MWEKCRVNVVKAGGTYSYHWTKGEVSWCTVKLWNREFLSFHKLRNRKYPLISSSEILKLVTREWKGHIARCFPEEAEICLYIPCLTLSNVQGRVIASAASAWLLGVEALVRWRVTPSEDLHNRSSSIFVPTLLHAQLSWPHAHYHVPGPKLRASCPSRLFEMKEVPCGTGSAICVGRSVTFYAVRYIIWGLANGRGVNIFSY